MVSTIGLKIANGEFYPIVDENSHAKKRLVLTTVHDNQQSVQIDLYRSYAKTMADALYMGSLVMEKLKPQPKGEPSIELVITSSRNGDVTADAVDLDDSSKRDRQSLSMSLKSLDDGAFDVDIPDFELESNETDSDDLFDRTTKKERYAERYEGEKRKFPWLLVVCAALILTAIGLAIWLFFFQTTISFGPATARVQQLTQGSRNESPAASPPATPRAAAQPAAAPPPATPAPAATPPASAPPASPPPASQPAASQAAASPPPASPPPAATPPASAPPAAVPAAVPAVASPPPTSPPPAATPPVIQAPVQVPAVITTPVNRGREGAPVATYAIPSVIPREGVPYRIRYGDTLWDIAEAFYRDPWLYPRIARFNNIRNPDLIIAGTTIRVPPRN